MINTKVQRSVYDEVFPEIWRPRAPLRHLGKNIFAFGGASFLLNVSPTLLPKIKERARLNCSGVINILGLESLANEKLCKNSITCSLLDSS